MLFEQIHFGKIQLLLAIPFRKYMASHGQETLRKGPETLTEWKSESVNVLNYGQG